MFSKETFQLVGDLLKQAREDKGLSQKEVSQKLGYSSPQFISNIERGLCLPPLKQLKVMVSLYGLNAANMAEIIIEAQSSFIREQLGIKSAKKNSTRSSKR